MTATAVVCPSCGQLSDRPMPDGQEIENELDIWCRKCIHWAAGVLVMIRKGYINDTEFWANPVAAALQLPDMWKWDEEMGGNPGQKVREKLL